MEPSPKAADQAGAGSSVRQVLRTYTRRSDFWVAAVLVVPFLSTGAALDTASHGSLAGFFLVLGEFLGGLCVGAHLREQIERPHAWLTPRYWMAHVTVAAGLAILTSAAFPALVLALAGRPLGPPLSLGVLVFGLAMAAPLATPRGRGAVHPFVMGTCMMALPIVAGVSSAGWMDRLGHLSPLPQALGAACVAVSLLRWRAFRSEVIERGTEGSPGGAPWKAAGRAGDHSRRGWCGRALHWRTSWGPAFVRWGMPLLLCLLVLNGYLIFNRFVADTEGSPRQTVTSQICLWFLLMNMPITNLHSPLKFLKGWPALLPVTRREYVREKLLALGAIQIEAWFAASVAAAATLAMWDPAALPGELPWVLFLLATLQAVTFCGGVYIEGLFHPRGDPGRMRWTMRWTALSAVFLFLGIAAGLWVAMLGMDGKLYTPWGAAALSLSLLVALLCLGCFRSGYRRLLEADLG